MTATANGRMTDESDGSSVLVWNHRALRRPVAVSLLLHAAIFTGALAWWQGEGAPAPKGHPDGFSVTLVNFSEPAPKAPQIQAKPVVAPAQPEVKPQPKPVVKPAVVERKVEPEPQITPDVTPEISAAAAEPLQAAEAAAQPVQTASLAPSVSDGRGQGAAKGFEDTQGRESDKVFLTEPRFRSPPRPPVYPRRARDLEQEGEALIRVRLDPSGNAAEVLVWKSSGFALLDKAALTAVRGWQFEPARRGGKPVVAWVQIPVRFALN
ncbi:energy transducer TonB [Parvibaculum lavamentivorans]|nr:energy transducer TonB [Parvibaculum lavamentivorans]